jgi:hypothetical protein
MKRVRVFATSSPGIFETFSPLYKVFKCCGVFTFSVCRSNFVNTFEVSVSVFDYIALVFWVCCHLVLFALNFYWGQQEPEDVSFLISKHGWHKIYLTKMLMLAWFTISNFTKRCSIVECLTLMDRFDLVKVTRDY